MSPNFPAAILYALAAVVFLTAGLLFIFLTITRQDVPSAILLILGFGLGYMRDFLKENQVRAVAEKAAEGAVNGTSTQAAQMAAPQAARDEADKRGGPRADCPGDSPTTG